MTSVYFVDENHHALGEVPDGEGYPLPHEATSTWWPRYRLKDGVVVDAYPGMSDEEAQAALFEQQEATRREREAAENLVNQQAAALIPRGDFMRRFTAAERHAYLRSTDVIVQDFVMLLNATDTVNLADTELQEQVRYLEELGLLETNRAAEILRVQEG